MSISTELGEQCTVQIPAGTIEYRERGSGSAIVFVHGVGVNGDLWRGVAPRLAREYRCVVPDLPWGSHSIPLRHDADLSLPGMARITADVLEGLALEDVTIVANDTGGAVAQALVGLYAERVGRLVLTSCDAFEKFPPTPQKYLKVAARSRALMWLVTYTARFKLVQRPANGVRLRHDASNAGRDNALLHLCDAGEFAGPARPAANAPRGGHPIHLRGRRALAGFRQARASPVGRE